ncbi:MAG: AAA family ATPase [Planctomycetota bacterium]
MRDVLKRMGLRPLTIATSEYNIKLLEAERLSREVGKSLWLTGPVLINHGYDWWNRIESRNLGARESPRKVVVDPDLESEGDSGRYYPLSNTDTASRLPFVRVFSLDTKRYVFADVEDLVPYEYDQKAIDNLHLPEEMVNILNKVFTAPSEAVFGDLIAGKHDGLVILASGNPGVGKTLTAEVYAELTQRPLYVLELGELGTNASQVEENLNRVFTRVARWDAVLQFDECEIFLAKRGNDLDRSAIVGIFLRLLDYYRGILFLTTNRPEVLDYAILSRVTLKLEYPDLDAAARISIWRTMLGIAQVGNLSDTDLEPLAELELNGRQIRNLVRLTTVIMDNQSVSVDKILELAKHS